MSGGSKRFSQDDAFVNVSFDDDTDGNARSGGDTFHKIFTDQGTRQSIYRNPQYLISTET